MGTLASPVVCCRSDGVTIDTTEPDLSGVTVLDGPGAEDADEQSLDLRVLTARWAGPIVEDVSPVQYIEWAVGTNPHADDVMPWTLVAASCAPRADWCARCDPPDANATCGAAAGPEVCVRLQYRMCGGQWGGLSTTYCRRWPGACPGPLVFPLQNHGAPKALLGYRVYRVDPDDEDRGCLKVEAPGPVLGPWAEEHAAFNVSCTAPAPVATIGDWELVAWGVAGRAENYTDAWREAVAGAAELRIGWSSSSGVGAGALAGQSGAGVPPLRGPVAFHAPCATPGGKGVGLGATIIQTASVLVSEAIRYDQSR